MKLKILAYLTIMLSFGILSAHSIFSFYGPAEMNYQRDTYSEGMGGTGLGDLFRPNVSLLNPALSTTIDKMHFATALSMGYTTYKNSENVSFKDDQIFLPFFNMIIPFRQHRLGVNFQNISSGRLSTEQKYRREIDEEEIHLTEIQRVDFTLFKAGIVYAYQNKYVDWGVGLNYIVGHDVRFFRQDYDSSSLMTSRFETEHTFNNPSIDIGLAKKLDNVSVGLAYSLPVELKGDSYFKTNTLNEKVTQAVFEYPAHAALGISWKVHELFFVSSDVDIELWGNTKNFENPVNTFRTGFGISWAGNKDSRRYLARMPLRSGISYKNLPFEINDHQISELAYHIGFSLPLKTHDSYLDVAVKFFQRGDENKHNLSENGFLLTIGTQGFDFLRRPANRKAPREIPIPDRR